MQLRQLCYRIFLTKLIADVGQIVVLTAGIVLTDANVGIPSIHFIAVVKAACAIPDCLIDISILNGIIITSYY